MVFSVRRWRILAIISIIIVYGLYHFMSTPYEFGDTTQYTPATQRPRPVHDGRLHWSKHKESFPVSSLIPLPTGKPVQIPPIQAAPRTETKVAKTERQRRLAAVKESFVHSWQGYKAEAWLRDEVVPIAGGYRDTFGGWAATLVDALDTLWIMDMKDDFEMAVDAVQKIDFTTTETETINVFETTIRYMGGFLAAYDISGAKYPVLLDKAVEVGELLMSCFDTPNRMPISRWRWESYVEGKSQKAPAGMLVSELGSLSLEFTRLSQLTGDGRYYDAVQRIANELEKGQNTTRLPGMWPVLIDPSIPSFAADGSFTLGGMSDSLYEYLPKQFLMLGGRLKQPRTMYENFIIVAKRHLFFRPLTPKDSDILVSGDARINEKDGVDLDPKGQHLTCFTGGMVAIASRIFDRPDDLEFGRRLTDGCVWAYESQPHGIAPELFYLIPCGERDPCKWAESTWHSRIQYFAHDPAHPDRTEKAIKEQRLPPGFTAIPDRRYILRPEAIESVFIMYRVTGDVEWQNKAWKMFEAIEKITKTKTAASAIHDVTVKDPVQSDSMESFWLAETLKYFYLVFADMDVVSLDDYVLNTEAHPLKRP